MLFPGGDVTLGSYQFGHRRIAGSTHRVARRRLVLVTVDHCADAKLLARQFLESIPASVPATLIASSGCVQDLVSAMAPDRGPEKLKLFEIAPRVIEPGLATLTRDFARAGVAPSRDRKSTRLNSSHLKLSRMPSSA